jgi:hypothetical protein
MREQAAQLRSRDNHVDLSTRELEVGALESCR